VQRGDSCLLSWPAPQLDPDESSRNYIDRVDIYRLAESRSEEPVLDADDYEAAAEVIGYLDRDTIEDLIETLGRLQYSDKLNLTSQSTLADTRIRYAVRYVNKRGQMAGFSNSVAVEPVAGVAKAPTNVRIASESQDQVRIEWTGPEANVDDTQPAFIVGYNVYRRSAKRERVGRPLNPDPITELAFIDTRFDYKTEYVYLVRALSQGTTGLIESIDSESVNFTPIDNFPPKPPDSVSIASANGVISLFWPSSSEPDVVGYNVYRTEAEGTPDGDWVKLTEHLTITTTYRDDRVSIGKRYYYRVSAMDRFSNESDRSMIVSETANP
jgi:fibronectin type 3 domain-containing protein